MDGDYESRRTFRYDSSLMSREFIRESEKKSPAGFMKLRCEEALGLLKNITEGVTLPAGAAFAAIDHTNECELCKAKFDEMKKERIGHQP